MYLPVPSLSKTPIVTGEPATMPECDSAHFVVELHPVAALWVGAVIQLRKFGH